MHTAQPEVAEPKRVVDREQLDVRQDEPASVVDHPGCVQKGEPTLRL